MAEAEYQYLDVARAEMVAFIPDSARCVLDVGCGRGGFGAELKRQRPDLRVVGIESDPGAAETARGRYDEVVVGLFPQSTPAGNFDCIVFNDVLEHMVDPWRALADARALLPDGGWIVASIPNLRYWPALRTLLIGADFEYTSDGVLDRTHLRFFTRKSMSTMVTEAGFALDRVTAINPMPADQIPRREYTALRLLERIRPRFVSDLRAQQYAIVGHKPGP